MRRRNVAMLNRRGNRRRLRWLLPVFLLLLCYYVWSQGGVGFVLRHQINTWLLPRSFGEDRVLLERLVVDRSGDAELLREGVRLTVSEAWVRSVLRASPYPSFLLPPGLLPDGLQSVGAFGVPQPGGDMLRLPFALEVRDDVALVPHLHARFPADKLNRLLDESFAEDWTETGEYLLGTYALEQSIRFDHLRIRSVQADVRRPLYPIVLRAHATGRLRYRFVENWLRATLTARVEELSMQFVLIPVAHADGVGFDYRASIDVLKLDVGRMAPWMERRLAKAARRSLERSLNKRRKRERLARRRLPLWLPMALSVDVEIVLPGEGAAENDL